ncbi:unnamed protein product [Cercospora beticola]|nr:unnamed protein product [Cercospora beticola]
MHLLSFLVGTASLLSFAASSIATPINFTEASHDVLKRQNTHPRQQWRTFRRGEQLVRSAPGNTFLQFEQRRFGGTIDYRFENDCLVRIYHNDYLMQTLGDEYDPSVQCTEPGSYGELSFTTQGFYEIVVYKPGQPPRRTWSPQWDVEGGRPEAGELEY